jgi:hypothetical protein
MCSAQALVRVACVMALPTDLEVEQAGAEDAGEFLIELHSGGGTAEKKGHLGELAAFVEARRVGWMHEPRQLAHRCVAHLLSLVVRTVERNTSRSMYGKSNRLVCKGEAAEFAARRAKGRALSLVTGRAGLLDGIRAAASLVRERLLAALRSVKLLHALQDAQLHALADAMHDAPFEHDEMVFEQGDEGDTFFVIIEGKVTILRTETDDDGNGARAARARASTPWRSRGWTEWLNGVAERPACHD